jgi:transposase
MEARRLYLHHQTKAKLKRLKKEAEQDGVYRVAKRIHAVLLNADGLTSGTIARLLDSPRSCTSEWLKNYAFNGYEGLLEGHRSGRHKELTDRQQKHLCDIIESGPVAYGFVSGVWTSIMITQVIAEEFSIDYHPGHVRKILYQMNFSVQRPRKQLAKADPIKQNKWRRYTYPNIKKKPKLTERK